MSEVAIGFIRSNCLSGKRKNPASTFVLTGF
jgi:hypothetical protein